MFTLRYRTTVLSVCNISVLRPNGWMDQDATWYEGRPRPMRHCIKWGPSYRTWKRAQQPHFSTHVYCGETVTHLSNCWGLVTKYNAPATKMLQLLGADPPDTPPTGICPWTPPGDFCPPYSLTWHTTFKNAPPCLTYSVRGTQNSDSTREYHPMTSFFLANNPCTLFSAS